MIRKIFLISRKKISGKPKPIHLEKIQEMSEMNENHLKNLGFCLNISNVNPLTYKVILVQTIFFISVITLDEYFIPITFIFYKRQFLPFFNLQKRK